VTAWFLPAPLASATLVSADSTDTLVETRWVQADSSDDQLTNYQELAVYGTNPAKPNTDEPGFMDGYEVSTGCDPTSAASSPETQMVIYTAVEVRFGAAQGQSYQVESSFDLQQ
jgi:hypothetical protein